MNKQGRDKLEELAGAGVSPWLAEAEARQRSMRWQARASEVALVILRTLRAKKMTQKELASRMGVAPPYINRIVKGHENLSLETIAKLEEALEVRLVEVAHAREGSEKDAPGWSWPGFETYCLGPWQVPNLLGRVVPTHRESYQA